MKRFGNILAVVDTSRSGVSALGEALSIAHNNNAMLTVASVLEEVPGEQWMNLLAVSAEDVQKIAETQERERLRKYLAGFNGADEPLEKRVLVGRASAEIVRQVLRGEHDLLVKDAEISDGLLDEILGSTDMHLLRKCPCPVLISWPGQTTYKRVMACVDYCPGDEQNDAINRKIVQIASSLARFHSAELHTVHAIEPFGEKLMRAAAIANKEMNFEEMVEAEFETRSRWMNALLEEHSAMREVGDGNDHVSGTHLVKGQAREVVPAKARELRADLIVLGTLSRTGIPGYFIGNTSENILNRVRCSVLTLKPDGFVSPITL